MIHSLLFARHIPRSQCKDLIKKIEDLSNRYFAKRFRHVHTMPDGVPQNPQLFFTVEMLDRAISAGRQVRFQYYEYGTDKKLHPRKDSTGAIRQYVVNPYRMVAANGRFYLVGNYDKYDNVAHYRLDRIKEIAVLEDRPVKPMDRVKGLENGLELPTHLAEHLYMFSGEVGHVTFRAAKAILGDVVDWFGNRFEVSDETEGEVTVRLRVNYEAMKFWAMQYAHYVTVLSPDFLVERIKSELLGAYERYLEKDEDKK
jgi:predicted DNA-binding transcriptional regulator YafY